MISSHAIMFHHFHNEHHPKGQGSLSADQFAQMLHWLSQRYHLLNADEYLARLQDKTLSPKDICLTFDDALLCQVDIAVPILNAKKIKAFFFVYSSPFMGMPDYLEIFRYFRMTAFDNIDAFYHEFFELAQGCISQEYAQAKDKFQAATYFKDYPFYTPHDKWFRFLRDNVLGKKRYEEMMHALMDKHQFKPAHIFHKLWMTDADLYRLHADGHILGLHSFSHPTMLHLLDKKAQAEEYRTNAEHLNKILGKRPIAMSHPCGNYNDDTLAILHQLGIQIGFRSNMSTKNIKSNLEIPREDHANILVEINNENNHIYQ